MIPVFCPEVFAVPTAASFTVSNAFAVNYIFSVTIQPGTYWLGAAAGSSSLASVVIAAFNAAGAPSSHVWSYQPVSLDDNLGASCQLVASGIGPGSLAIVADNAAAEFVLWSLGFRNMNVVVMSATGTTRTATTTGIPYGTWWPKARNVISDRFTPTEVQAFSSPIPGSGSIVASVRQEPATQGRWFRTWRILPIAAARCSVRRAVSNTTPQWAVIAGLTTNPGDAALDNPDWWWARTLDGSRRFVAIEDEATLVSGTVRFGEYRFAIGERSQPVAMGGWSGLKNVTQYGPAGSTQQAEFCALWTGQGNL